MDINFVKLVQYVLIGYFKTKRYLRLPFGCILAHNRDLKKNPLLPSCVHEDFRPIRKEDLDFFFLYDWLLFETDFVVYPAKKALKLDEIIFDDYSNSSAIS